MSNTLKREVDEAIQELEHANNSLQKSFGRATTHGAGEELLLPEATLKEIDQAFARIAEAEKKLGKAWRNFCINIKRQSP